MKGKASFGRRKSRPRKVNEYRASTPPLCGTRIPIGLDDEVIEMILAP